MKERSKRTETRRKRPLSRVQKMRGSLKGDSSPLETLLKERHEEQQMEEMRFKQRGARD